MSGVPADVLAQRVANSLQRAVSYNAARDHKETRAELERARVWLDRLRDAIK